MSDFLFFSDWDPTHEDGHGSGHLSDASQPYHYHNTMEGSEFMDESLRMNEQLLDPDEADLI